VKYSLLQTVNLCTEWLESDQINISHYFDHYPPTRCSFLEAVQRVTGYESFLTPAATPGENALDNEPAVSGSKEVTNRTGSIIHNEADEQTHGEEIIITNEGLLDLEIQRP